MHSAKSSLAGRDRRTSALRVVSVGILATAMTASAVGGARVASAQSITQWSTSFTAGGTTYTATNHLTAAAGGPGRQWLLAWAGPTKQPAPDFLAVIDATPSSPTYGKVVNTVTMGPNTGEEPHHMEYVWHKGDLVYAGGILADTTYVFDVKALPAIKLVGVNTPADTPCGTLPDAFQVLSDGTAYGSYMGGANVAGPCTYTNGQVRDSNGAGGSPGEIIHFGKQGQTLAEIPAATDSGENPQQCGDVPALPEATCANPHGIGVREDLNVMVTSDFAEARNFMSPQAPLVANLARQTVRVFDIKNENNPTLMSVSTMKDGPRSAQESARFWDESRVVMETALTNQHQHRGAFVSSMAGGAVYYTPDVTAKQPKWNEVFDDTTAYMKFHPDGSVTGGGDNSSWLAVSPDDRYLYHAVMGQSTPYGKSLNVTSGMIYVLDIRKLLADGNKADCSIDTLSEVYHGGTAKDCPALAGVVPIRDTTDGGPHWGAMDNFTQNRNGTFSETTHIQRVAVADYFVAGSFGGGGDHQICMFNTNPATGAISLDRTFRDENAHQPCVQFNRASWPHGDYGDAQPHGVLFVVSNNVLR